MGDFIIGGKTVTSLQINNKEVIRIANGQTVLWEKVTPVPVITYAESITQDTDTCTGWLETSSIDTGVAHATSTTTVRIIYQPKCGRNPQDVWNFCDRIVGYINHNVSNSDFRIFGYNSGTFDYSGYRNSNINIIDTNTVYDLTLGDCYVYDNQNNTYLCQTTTKGSVPTLNEHIFVDVQYTNVMRVIIQDGNTVLFDGKAAYDNLGHIGLYDEVSQSMKYNSDLQMRYEDYTPTTHNYVTITNTSQNSGTFSVWSSDNIDPNYSNLEYSLDNGTTWTSLNTVSDSVTVPSGDSILLRGTGNGAEFDNEEYTNLNFSQPHTVSGDLATLIDYNTAPILTVPRYAYYKLFYNDTTLTSAELFDTDFDKGGQDTYKRLFAGCTNLSSVAITTNNWDTVKTGYWLTNVAASGTIVVNGDETNLPTNSESGVPTGWNCINLVNNMLRFTAQQANSTVALTPASGLNLTLYKSTDGVNFSSWDGTAVTLSNIGDTLWVYGTNQTISTSSSSYTKFVMTGRIAADGDVTYLFQYGGLTTVPNNYGLHGLFQDCRVLTTPPEIPITTLTNGCYQKMFENCYLLTQAPQLPVTTLADFCYDGMFANCRTLEVAPELPATTLAAGCYAYMFVGCTSLTQSPILRALTIAPYAYYQMFDGCVLLNTVTCLATDISATNATPNWLYGVAQTGIFYKSTVPNWPTGASGIPTGWTAIDKTTEDYFYVQARENNSIVAIPSGVAYSTDKVNWNTSGLADGIELNAGDIVYLAEMAGWIAGSSIDLNVGTFNVGGKFSYFVTGDGTPEYPTVSHSYHNLFRDSTGLIDVSNLKLDVDFGTTTHVFAGMFYGCTNLLTTPELPVTALTGYCYYEMFRNCSSLLLLPELPATTLDEMCYEGMFFGCTSLLAAPALPATTLADSCYLSMFHGCTSLKTAPELPATTLANYCYQGMFSGCTSLVKAPNLPATTTAAFCYTSMFKECSSLNYIKVNITESWSTLSAAEWVLNVAASGTFVKPTNTNIPTGDSGIPSGWTVVTVMPTLPAPIITYEDYTTECWDGSYAFDGDGYAVASYNTIQNATFYMRYCADGDDITQEVWEQTDNITITSGDYIIQAKATKSGWTDSPIATITATVEGYTGCPEEPDPCQECYDACEGDPDCEAACDENECGDPCDDWESQGYACYDECNGGSCPDPCQECYDSCEGDPDCEASCYECDQACGDPCDDPCADCGCWEEEGYECYEDCMYGDPCPTDCTDCANNWEECSYESYEDCDCAENGNCPEEEEEPEEQEP